MTYRNTRKIGTKVARLSSHEPLLSISQDHVVAHESRLCRSVSVSVALDYYCHPCIYSCLGRGPWKRPAEA